VQPEDGRIGCAVGYSERSGSRSIPRSPSALRLPFEIRHDVDSSTPGNLHRHLPWPRSSFVIPV